MTLVSSYIFKTVATFYNVNIDQNMTYIYVTVFALNLNDLLGHATHVKITGKKIWDSSFNQQLSLYWLLF